MKETKVSRERSRQRQTGAGLVLARLGLARADWMDRGGRSEGNERDGEGGGMNGLGWDEMDGWKDGRWMGWMVRKRVRWAASCLGLVLVLHGRSAAGGAQAERGDGGTKDEHQQWRERVEVHALVPCLR